MAIFDYFENPKNDASTFLVDMGTGSTSNSACISCPAGSFSLSGENYVISLNKTYEMTNLSQDPAIAASVLPAPILAFLACLYLAAALVKQGVSRQDRA